MNISAIKRLWLPCFSIPALALFAACFQKQSHEITSPQFPAYTVHLIVLNIDSNKPMPETQATMSAQKSGLLYVSDRIYVSGMTDSSGNYDFEQMCPGMYEINCLRQGYLIFKRLFFLMHFDTTLYVKIPDLLVTTVRYKHVGKDVMWKYGICWKDVTTCANIGLWKPEPDSKQNYQRIFEGNFDQGFQVIGAKIFENENPELSGLIWVNPNYLSFTGGMSDPKICLLDATKGNIVGHFTVPHRLMDLTYDGQFIWATATNYKILKLSRYSQTPVAEYPSPGKHPTAIAYDGSQIWSFDEETGYLYRHAEDMKVDKTLALGYQDENYHRFRLTGVDHMAFDHLGKLWVISTNGIVVHAFSPPLD